MTVREFNGTSHTLDTAVGALATNTFGTFAVIVKRTTANQWQTFLALHATASSGARNQFAYSSSNNATLWGSNVTAEGPAAPLGVWVLVVARKASGNAVPRFSMYNYTTATWTHGNGNASFGNWASPSATGRVRMSWEGADLFGGRIAVRAAWNTVPWPSNTTGDGQIETAGLEDSLQSWIDANPDALWTFNQPATTTPVEDLTGGGADQTAITGTTVIAGDDPPGFTFTQAHQVTTTIPLSLVVSPTTETTHQVTASIPLTLDVEATTATAHQVTAPIELSLILEPVTTQPGSQTTGFITGPVDGPDKHDRSVDGPARGRAASGPRLRRIVTGPALSYWGMTGLGMPNKTRTSGPSLSHTVDGPVKSRHTTGPYTHWEV